MLVEYLAYFNYSFLLDTMNSSVYDLRNVPLFILSLLFLEPLSLPTWYALTLSYQATAQGAHHGTTMANGITYHCMYTISKTFRNQIWENDIPGGITLCGQLSARQV